MNINKLKSSLNPISIEDYYSFRFLTDATVSPDGTNIAYVIESYHDKPKPQTPIPHSSFKAAKTALSQTQSSPSAEFSKIQKSNIWIYSVTNKTTHKLTHGEMNIAPSFSPDSRRLVFTSKRKGIPQLFLLDLYGGEAKQLTFLPQGVITEAEWSPDGKRLVFAATPKKVEPKKKPYRITRDIYRYDAWGYVEDFKFDIFVLDLEERPYKITQMTDDEANHIKPIWSPDGKKILCLKSFTFEGNFDVFPQIEIIEGDKILSPMKNWGRSMNATWITNTQICLSGEPIDPERPIGSKADLFVYDLKKNEFNNRSIEFPYQINGGLESDMPFLTSSPLIISNDKHFAYVSVQAGGNIGIYKIGLIGEESCQLIVGGDRVNYIRKIQGDNLFYISSHQNNPRDLFIFNQNTKNDEQITRLNQSILSTKALPSIERLKFYGIDDIQVEGWFWKPSIGEAPFPTILHIHGGPHGAIGNIFDFDNQFLCGAGYAVLVVNHRASTGYGNAFGTAVKGDWGNLDYYDLMAGVDKAIELGLADPDRLGCCGISAGGYLSCYIVGKTRRFKAAIPENPITNWQSYYGTSDIGRWYSISELGGLPHEIPEIYRHCSPINFAHNCTTPTLLIQHDNDLRCPSEQTDQFYAVLRDAGCVVEMLRMPGTSHAGSTIGPLEFREVQNRAYLEWFGRNVLGDC